MERMWRKVNQGLTSTTSTVFKQSRTNHNNDSNNQPSLPSPPLPNLDDIDDGPVYANVPYYNRGWGYIDTSKCRKRRRKAKPRRNRYTKIETKNCKYSHLINCK